MCLAVPLKVIDIKENDMAIVEIEGVKRSVSLLLLENVELGNYVIVHAGFAIQVLDEKIALESLDILRKASSASER